jgi:hypothetical protein
MLTKVGGSQYGAPELGDMCVAALAVKQHTTEFFLRFSDRTSQRRLRRLRNALQLA